MITLLLGLLGMLGLLLGHMAHAGTLVVGRDAPSVQGTLDLASEGDVVVLPDGSWPGPAVVRTPVTLRSDGGVLTGQSGTTLRVDAPGVVLDGLHVRGSGQSLQGNDACVFISPRAAGTVVRDSRIEQCLFGIWLHEVRGVQVLDTYVSGLADAPEHGRGNGIHLFDSEQLLIRGNQVVDARDGIYVSATEDSHIVDNQVSGQRFGIHYMYSYDNTIQGNVANDNTGGIALMQSRRLQVLDNVAVENDRHGILFRDVQYTTISGNRVEGNAEGMFFFSSLDNVIVDNELLHNQIGARVWAGTERNEVHDNAFVGNREQVFYVSSSDQTWGANYWSDYLGWDQDGDGRGDRPYRNDALLAQLLHRYPAAVLLLNSPGLELLRMLQQRLPALRVPTVIDEHPLLAAPTEGR